jgi:hypothetical protein
LCCRLGAVVVGSAGVGLLGSVSGESVAGLSMRLSFLLVLVLLALELSALDLLGGSRRLEVSCLELLLMELHRRL